MSSVYRSSNAAGDVPRRALAKLSADQRDTFQQLLDGFETRSEVLRWMSEVTIHTLGALEDDWFAEVVSSPGTMSALLSEPWGTLRDAPESFSASTASEIRRSIAVMDLLPAIKRSHREFRWSAKDYLNDDDDGPLPNARTQAHPAMRPELGTLQSRMSTLLDELLRGFRDEDAFVEWGQEVVQASYAEVDSDVIEAAYFELPVRRMMLTDSERARFFRESWAAEFFLSGFNASARQVSGRATEVPQIAKEETFVPSG
ncbi:hypothetical protein E6P09_07630 [Haloferax mediterranei ATCC 33500]|uniref:Uncharacterized protein n=1 Tax=Haloferax mediterranei (strain ATCC 33500 / DSM 1411 / JCM 8866 / NBRC 14739 / NCIMB 2177 / R-4) TaxID=523841 RepID=I3R328_HALMT|nr:hypothetical protein [Haloferax mediterranei]AFK18638.1 hypothetical protein HFX_0917 [Haloferax mediterranei ATCC 33500]AHZ21990.1 hypothetical protein BM92_04630 [Haloferax mediterranei ATCC 33500]EMA02086.1 hypothetical protein C439_05885 [Haloferax mediterranei ATCC 33500]MDX5988731.1 hypothetical protein [Haloferax mediterranei ATCC 33500]QCQ75138.1 hypothetical protein E6P09_07630 [Haloferax mediterranei ATCC 33500]